MIYVVNYWPLFKLFVYYRTIVNGIMIFAMTDSRQSHKHGNAIIPNNTHYTNGAYFVPEANRTRRQTTGKTSETIIFII